jgi:hypothetical protein
LGDEVFSGIANLTIYYLPGTTGWGSKFAGRPALLWNPMFQAHGVQGGCAYAIGDGAVSIKRYVGTDTEVLVPETIVGLPVTSISDWAFLGCNQVNSVTLPASIKEIGEGAFRACTELTTMVIPENVTSVGPSAFAYCTSLTSIVIPDGVTSIGSWAFPGCTSLTSIVIPNSVMRIGTSAFYGCTSLTSVVIGNGVTSIGRSAFKGCTGLTTLTIPDSVTVIEGGYDWISHTTYGAFAECTGLRTVTIGESVSYVGEDAFVACRNLISAYFRGSPPDLESLEWGMFFDTPVTVYYLPGVEGWGSEFSGRPAVPGNAHLTARMQPDGLRLTLTAMAGLSVLVEAGADLLGTEWTPLFTGTLTDGLAEISDPEWAEHSARFYRVRSPE